MLAGYLACVTLGLVGYALLKWQHDANDRHARETMSPEAYESYVMSRGEKLSDDESEVDWSGA